ncbi:MULTISPECIES: discoidin domain-containing protein [unclassified Streptomyces]|uniref:discoidin domain-containing protein n=1 Tax=unclassified Streptomyces TaxID=2593676 RepID=UPI00278BEAE7|nr:MULTISPECIES: discoidin domain-containing protein [unclassified Streptomyces]
MSHHLPPTPPPRLPLPLHRRGFLQAVGLTSAMAALPALTGADSACAADGSAAPPDDIAATYHRVLLIHTRWSETQWDGAAGHYTAKDFGFAVVLGNAVLLTHGTYDSARAGVDRDTLKARTLATIRHFAASNRLTGGTEWGRKLFFDTTFQSYFVLAARLLWDELDATTRSRVDTITREQAAYTTSLGTGDDPDSGDWTPNGLKGGHAGDTKLEEMGLYAQTLAPALAWAPDDPRRGDWESGYGVWSRNEAGLPPADLANPALVDGVRVSRNSARNLYDTFIVENHGSFGPHYQEELWRTSGRNAAHFLAAGRPLPEVLTRQPNARPLWRTLLGVMSDAGEPLMPMVNDREHLYGRDVIPLAFLARVTGDRSAAWAEQALAERLEAYQKYPPQYRLAKFSGEPKYEPEARAELAISYLLHVWAAERGDEPVHPYAREEVFEHARGVTDFGAGPGLVSHQSRAAWAGAVGKSGFVKFGWQPGHDDWLFRLSGATPMFLPSTAGEVTAREVRVYESVRDGFDGSASVLQLGGGYAGFATLPTGSVVYASTGTGAGEGHLEVHNLTMPGMAGLDGSRAYRFEEGGVSVRARDEDGSGSGARVDQVEVPRTAVRHVRMLGVRPDPTYGYSLYALEVRDGADGPDLARGGAATASSSETGRGAALAVDGDPTTRWAVAKAERPRADSWLAVDLGATHDVDRVTVRWEAAAGRAYRVQGSTDGTHWEDLATWPEPDVRSRGGWLDVDGRAGLVVRGGGHPIAVYGDTIVAADGPAAPVVVEGFAEASAGALRAAATGPFPTAASGAVHVSLTDGHLAVFNLSGGRVTTPVSVPQEGTRRTAFEGDQTVTDDGTAYHAELDAGQAVLLAPRCTLTPLSGDRLPTGLRIRVVDGATVRLSGAACRVRVAAQGRSAVAVVTRARETAVHLPGATAFPLDDLALGRSVFPTGPLPDGMSDPGAAVDGDRSTSWRPGPGGRLVVDLGEDRAVRTVEAQWTVGGAPPAEVELSADGLAYRGAGRLDGKGPERTLKLGSATARYVAFAVVAGGRATDARLVRLSVR